MDECESLSREGLRTLAITQKYLTEDNLKNFTTEHEKAKYQMGEREAHCSKILDFYENDMELLGLTRVKDMFQEDIYATLESRKMQEYKSGCQLEIKQKLLNVQQFQLD
ncbi:unnamed protein product [Paramecium pentaurelia]|uniref:Uncharacterized protein n=1 Tax=Paramecium pentaurelia TaxID=43138 RepID=A0A8S1VFY5_9CILI|nr:unnamed protein product [Paramecium pentaurelia]